MKKLNLVLIICFIILLFSCCDNKQQEYNYKTSYLPAIEINDLNIITEDRLFFSITFKVVCDKPEITKGCAVYLIVVPNLRFLSTNMSFKTPLFNLNEVVQLDLKNNCDYILKPRVCIVDSGIIRREYLSQDITVSNNSFAHTISNILAAPLIATGLTIYNIYDHTNDEPEN